MTRFNSAIEEYYLCRSGIGSNPMVKNSKVESKETTNEELHEMLVRLRKEQHHHLVEQDELLTIIRNQSKPQFGREVAANIVGSIAYDGLRYLFKCLKI